MQMKSTLFCLTCHIESNNSNFTLFEKEKTSPAKSVEAVYDVNSGKVVMFESEADIETPDLREILASLRPVLPQVKIIAKKFIKNYISERLQATGTN